MSIFQKPLIRVGDLVIGIKKSPRNRTETMLSERSFEKPAMVLEITGDNVLVFFEQEGPTWYNLSKLERVYVTEEFTDIDRKGLAPVEFNNSDQSRHKDDNGNK